MSCSVPRCNHRNRRFSKKITYHRFPISKANVYEQWVQNISVGNRNFKVTNTSRVCSIHFAEECFMKGISNGRRLLHSDAVPTIFLWDDKVFVDSTINKNQAECDVGTILLPTPLIQKENYERTESKSQEETGITQTGCEFASNFLEATRNDVSKASEVCNVMEQTQNDVSKKREVCNVMEQTQNAGNTDFDDRKNTSSFKNCNSSFNAEKLILEMKCHNLEKKAYELTKENDLLKSLLNLKSKHLRSKTLALAKEKIKVRVLQNKMKRLIPKMENLKGNNSAVNFYTGLPNYEKLLAVFNFLDAGETCSNLKLWDAKDVKKGDKRRPMKLEASEQFLMVMMRLRLGLFVRDLADRFSISVGLVSKVTITWINLMYAKFGQLSIWPSREQVDLTMPEEFKKDFPKTRVIINATEIKVERPISLILPSGTVSNYKSYNTMKGLIGIDPAGSVTFVSSLFTGCHSDKEITRRSGLLHMKFNHGDVIMVDKEFLVEDLLTAKGLSLNIWPFLKNNNQFSGKSVNETPETAALIIHVKRQIQRVRWCHIFDRPIPISLCPIVNQIWTVCTLLTNMQSPLISQSKDYVEDVESVINLQSE